MRLTRVYPGVHKFCFVDLGGYLAQVFNVTDDLTMAKVDLLLQYQRGFIGAYSVIGADSLEHTRPRH